VHSSAKELQGELNLHRRTGVAILADPSVEATTILTQIYLRFTSGCAQKCAIAGETQL